MNTSELVGAIEVAFSSVKRPDDSDYTISKGEAFDESSEFFGRSWQELDADFLERNRGVIYWFNPEAFYYYLPAFLKASLVTNDVGYCFIDSILFLLLPPDEKEDFHLARWRLLNDDQISVLRRWLVWLSDMAQANGSLQHEANEGLDVIDSRLWW